MWQNMNKKNNIVLAVVLVLVVAGVAFLIYKNNKKQDYSIVYLTTGEVYIGKIVTFPDFQLTNGYILQIAKDPADPTKNNFQLNPIKDALWAPQVLHLVKDNIVFYGPLLSDSVIAKKLAEQVQE